jgi:hypothetical protein
VKSVGKTDILRPAISAFPPSMVVKQWRKPRRRIRELIKLGVRKPDAISLGYRVKVTGDSRRRWRPMLLV